MTNLLDILTACSIAGYVALAIIPLVISANVREGPSYWPAFTFVALASGLPGVYFALTVLMRLLGFIPQVADLNQRITTMVVIALGILLQGGALRQVRRENARWRAEGRFKRARRRDHQEDLGKLPEMDAALARMEARE